MAAFVDIKGFAPLLRDMHPSPGERIKQWVADTRREDTWERETCPKVFMPDHTDNCDSSCRNAAMSVPWTWLEDHDCCYTCNDKATSLAAREDVAAWLAERSKRPPIESDRSKLSDEVQPDFGPSPSFAMGRR